MSRGEEADLVMDTGPLSHLAKAGWLSVIRAIAGNRAVIIPDAVEAEIRQGLHIWSHLQQVLDADWIVRRELVSEEELAAFAGFASRLVVGTRNVGEAAVLAYAQVHGATAVIDDRVATKAGRDARVRVEPTLALLSRAIYEGLLTLTMVSTVADHLIETEYRLPFEPGGFAAWAERNGLLTSPREDSE